jgi:hypothetical protein
MLPLCIGIRLWLSSLHSPPFLCVQPNQYQPGGRLLWDKCTLLVFGECIEFQLVFESLYLFSVTTAVFSLCFRCWTQLVSMHVETAVVKVTSAADCNEAISSFDVNKAKAEYVCLSLCL